MQVQLFDIETSWLNSDDQVILFTNWNQFMECVPYKRWKPYVVSSWSWDKERGSLQIIFSCVKRESGKIMIVETPIRIEEEPSVRRWLKNHMSAIWKI